MENSKHYTVIDDYERRLTIKFKGKVIAATENSRILKEVGKSVYNPVFYFPKEDIKVELKEEKSRKSHCPIKGDATYWQMTDEITNDYFAWSYEEPLSQAKKVEGYIAFNISELTVISEPI